MANKPAITLYLSMGFVVADDAVDDAYGGGPRRYGVTQVVMRLALDLPGHHGRRRARSQGG